MNTTDHGHRWASVADLQKKTQAVRLEGMLFFFHTAFSLIFEISMTVQDPQYMDNKNSTNALAYLIKQIEYLTVPRFTS